jgi:hypothetical protein
MTVRELIITLMILGAVGLASLLVFALYASEFLNWTKDIFPIALGVLFAAVGAAILIYRRAFPGNGA